MTPKKLVILGSTGSIGRSTIDVINAHPGCFAVRALAAYSNVDLLVEQYRMLRPQYLCLVAEAGADLLRARLKGEPVEILVGREALISLAGLDDVDMVVNAVVGAAGMLVSLETIKNGTTLALANKESLVCGGPLFPPLVKKHETMILPIDSEHSAIWQALTAGRENELRHVIITASGGPFRALPLDKFDEVTVEQALSHPTWKMGPKITVDSATLVNKGLEVLEAVVLFSVPAEKIKVVIHPQSIIHSMVEFIDSSIIAQLSRPDMRLPISYALFWPDRVESEYGRLDPAQMGDLTFAEPDLKRFRALKIAYEVAETSGTAPAVFNAANEAAVDGFLKRKLKFTQITDIIEQAVNNINVVSKPSLDDILEADRKAREFAKSKIG